MLSEIKVKNFKCFGSEATFPIAKLTLLTGINGRGKSTAVQPLLCLRQSAVMSPFEQVLLEGEYAQFGTFFELRNRDVPADDPVVWTFEFETDDQWARITWELSSGDSSAIEVPVVRLSMDTHDHGAASAEWDEAAGLWDTVGLDEEAFSDFSDLHDINDTFAGNNWNNVAGHVGIGISVFRGLRYVCADRIGPVPYSPPVALGTAPSVGIRGERTAEVLSRAKVDAVPVSAARSTGTAVPRTLYDQAGAWLREIFDGGALDVGPTDAVVRTIRMNADGSPYLVRPSNTGYGFSAVLPLIVEGLVASPGDILIVENPEAHLHPMAASRIAGFLACVASDGVQVIIETHSEHVLNGARIGVRNGVLQPEDVSVLYFRRHPSTPVLRIPVEKDGRIDSWPDGFFDQASKDLSVIHNY